MSNAGLNKQDDGFSITCLIYYTRELLKSLEVNNKGKEDTFEEGSPILPTTANNHEMGIDDKKKEAYRTVVVNGKQIQQKLENYKEIKIKHAEWKKREGIEDKNKDQDAR